MRRFNFLLLALATISSAAFGKEWQFDVYLDAEPIGEHRFILSEAADGQRELVSQADFNVKFLFFNAYRYHHIAREHWAGDCLHRIEARTEENNDVTLVQGKLEKSGFTLQSPNPGTLDACVMGFAYWNPKMLSQSRLLNPQTGEWMDSRITRLGKERIELKGQAVEADHYKLEATKVHIDLWYSEDQDWLALKSITPEGYVIDYKLR
ncbi:MAG: DUF6134 family protein [Methylococcales bacterium]